MAEIPSDIASSAAQAAIRAREIADAREAGRAGRANAAQRHAKSIEEAGSTVDTEDADSRAFTDSEGAGSKGRADEEALEADAEESSDGPTDGITTDANGEIHLDLEA